MKQWGILFLFSIFLMLGSIPAQAQTAKSKVVSVGVIPRYNPMIMYQNYQPIMDYLTRNTSYRFELKLARNYPETVEHLRTGVTQVAFLGDVTFVAASRNFNAKAILRPRNQFGKANYYSLIVVRKDSPLTEISHLKQQHFAFGNIHSTSGNLIPRHFLFQRGITLEDFASYQNLPTHTDVARAVLKGQFAAGALKDVVAYQFQEAGLRILAKSPEIPSVPIVVRPNTPPELIDELTKALLKIDPVKPEFKQILKTWDPEFRNGFVLASNDDYHSIRQMLSNISGGCGKSCHPQ